MAWAELLEIYRENARARHTELVTPPVACPLCGEPLDIRADGARNCPWGDYRYSG